MGEMNNNISKLEPQIIFDKIEIWNPSSNTKNVIQSGMEIEVEK